MLQYMHYVVCTTSMTRNTCKPCLHASTWKNVASNLQRGHSLTIERIEHQPWLLQHIHTHTHTYRSYAFMMHNTHLDAHDKQAIKHAVTWMVHWACATDCMRSLLIHTYCHTPVTKIHSTICHMPDHYLPTTSVDAHPLEHQYNLTRCFHVIQQRSNLCE